MIKTEQQPYHYTECGLDNVFIYGMNPITDDKGEKVFSIPKINKLHKSITEDIVSKQAMIAGKELRFIRTRMGLTQSELAKIIHKDHQTVGRWEREETLIDQNAELIIRLLAIEKLELRIKIDLEATAEINIEKARTCNINIDGSNADYKPYKQAA